MKRPQAWAAAVVLLVAAGMWSAGGAAYWRRYATEMLGGGVEASVRLVQPRLRLPGESRGLPRSTPEAELIEAEALQQAAEAARLHRAKALLVHRHGHRVFEYFGEGRNGATEVQGGELAPALLALSLGPLVDARRLDEKAAVASLREIAGTDDARRNPWSSAARRRFNLAPPPALLLQDLDGSIAHTLSTRVWLPLGASDAALWGEDDRRLRVDCCVVARLDDWMRVADLFVQMGVYQGQRIVSPDWIRHLLDFDAQGHAQPVWVETQLPWTGDEPPAARDAYWFDLGTDARVWIVPRRNLTILYWGGSSKARDTLVPNIVLRGLQDQLPAGAAMELDGLVPGH